MIKSTLGSPTPIRPKSMTPVKRPCAVRMLNRDRSPWNHIGGPAYGGTRRADSHAAVAAWTSMIPSRAASAARTSASCSPSGAPRLAGGPPMGSVARKAVMKSARSSTARLGSTNSAADGFSPATQRHTDHGQPNPSAGLPNPTGTGLATLDAQRSAAATVARSEGSRWPSQCAGCARPGPRLAGTLRCPCPPSAPVQWVDPPTVGIVHAADAAPDPRRYPPHRRASLPLGHVRTGRRRFRPAHRSAARKQSPPATPPSPMRSSPAPP